MGSAECMLDAAQIVQCNAFRITMRGGKGREWDVAGYRTIVCVLIWLSMIISRAMWRHSTLRAARIFHEAVAVATGLGRPCGEGDP